MPGTTTTVFDYHRHHDGRLFVGRISNEQGVMPQVRGRRFIHVFIGRLETYQSAFAEDDETLEFLCLSQGMKERSGQKFSSLMESLDRINPDRFPFEACFFAPHHDGEDLPFASLSRLSDKSRGISTRSVGVRDDDVAPVHLRVRPLV